MKKKELEIAITTYTVAYKKGYTQCQEDMADKKYTEDDMLKCWNAACVNSFGFDEESYELNAYSDFINSLNKQD